MAWHMGFLMVVLFLMLYVPLGTERAPFAWLVRVGLFFL